MRPKRKIRINDRACFHTKSFTKQTKNRLMLFTVHDNMKIHKSDSVNLDHGKSALKSIRSRIIVHVHKIHCNLQLWSKTNLNIGWWRKSCGMFYRKNEANLWASYIACTMQYNKSWIKCKENIWISPLV